jgi:hypothetical protein
MSVFDKTISEEIKNDICSEHQVLGPCYALEWFQRTLIIMQDKLWLKRVQINIELSNLIAKPLHWHSHLQVMELSKCFNLLLGMKERANGAYYLAYYHNTVINIVNLQLESGTATQFVTEQSHLELSRLLWWY